MENTTLSTQLRIGNWIEVFTVKNRWEQLQIRSGLNIEEVCKAEEDPDDDRFRPIPLDEKWLVKFGFEETPNQKIIRSWNINLPMIGNKILSVTIEQGNQYIYIKDFDTDDYTLKPYDLVCLRNYDSHGEFLVNQLQNLYHSLTGEELQIANSAQPEPKSKCIGKEVKGL